MIYPFLQISSEFEHASSFCFDVAKKSKYTCTLFEVHMHFIGA